MPVKQVENPGSPLTTNVFQMEINGELLEGISKVDGISQGVGTLERGDGGTGRKFKFSDNAVTCDPITITVTVDPTDPKTTYCETFFQNAITSHTKYNASLIVLYQGSEYLRILFTGLLFTKSTEPGLDKVGSAAYETTYNVECDAYEKVYSTV